MKTTIIALIILMVSSCKSTNSITEERYNLLNDILSASTNEKQYLTCYCNEEINFSDVTKIFYSSKNNKIFRREFLSSSKEYLDDNKTNWIFDKEDISYFKETYKDSIYYNCWDKNKIKHNVNYLTCNEVEDLYSDENVKEYAKGKSFPISKTSQAIYVSLPFFNRNKTKAFFLFSDSKNETTTTLAIAKKIEEKWIIIGLIYDGYD